MSSGINIQSPKHIIIKHFYFIFKKEGRNLKSLYNSQIVQVY